MPEISKYDLVNNPDLEAVGLNKTPQDPPIKVSKTPPASGSKVSKYNVEGYTPTGIEAHTGSPNSGFLGSSTDDVVTLGTDLNEERAARQSTTENMFSSLAKGTGLMISTAASLATTLPEGIVRASIGAFDPDMSGSEAFSKTYDNSSSQFWDRFNKGAETLFPVYKPESYDKESLLQNMGTSQFWGETILKNAGFTAGAIIGGGKVAKGLQALGRITMGARAAESIAAASALIEAGETPFAAARKVGSMIPYAMDKATQVATGAIVSFGEASMEAKQVKDELTEQLVNQYKNTNNGKDPDAQSMSRMIDYASAAGNTTLAVNMAVLTGLETLQFGKLWTRGFKEEVDRVGKIVVKDGINEAVEDSFKKKAAKYVGAYGKNTFSEAAEEGIQTGTQAATKDYYSRKYDKQGLATTQDGILAVLTGMQETFGTKGGLESMLAGAITGIGSHAATSAIQRVLGGNTPSEFESATALATKLNAAGEKAAPYINSMVRAASINKEQEKNLASPNPNRKKFEDGNAESFRAFVQPYIETGSFDLLEDKLNQEYAKDEDRFKLDNGDTATRKSGKEFVSKLMQDAKKLKANWDNMQDVMPKVAPAIKERMWSTAADIENRNERFNNLNTELFAATGVNYKGQSREEYLAAIEQVTPDITINQKAGDIVDLFEDKKALVETYKGLQDPDRQLAILLQEAIDEENKKAIVPVPVVAPVDPTVDPPVVKTEDEQVKEKFDSDLRQLGVDLKTGKREDVRAKIQNTFDTSTDPVEKRVATQLLAALDRGDAKVAKDKADKEAKDKADKEAADKAAKEPSDYVKSIYNNAVDTFNRILKEDGKQATLISLNEYLVNFASEPDVLAAIKLMIIEVEADRPLTKFADKIVPPPVQPAFVADPAVVKLLETYFTLNSAGSIDAPKLFEFIEKFGNASQQELLARLLEILGDVNVGLMDETMAAKYQTGAAYTTQNGKPIILFNLAYLEQHLDVNGLKNYLTKVINHELLHYLTVDKLDENGEFAKSISAQLKIAQAAAKQQGLSGIDIEYGLQDEHEYLAEAFSNPEFQKFLDTIDSQTPGVSLWEKFIELLNRSLGLKINSSLLGDTIAVVSSEFGIAPIIAPVIVTEDFAPFGTMLPEGNTYESYFEASISNNTDTPELAAKQKEIVALYEEAKNLREIMHSNADNRTKAQADYKLTSVKSDIGVAERAILPARFEAFKQTGVYKQAIEGLKFVQQREGAGKGSYDLTVAALYLSKAVKGEANSYEFVGKALKTIEEIRNTPEYVEPPSITDDPLVQESTEGERMAGSLLRTSANHDDAIKNGLHSVLRYQNFVNNLNASFTGLKFRVINNTDPLYRKLQNKTQATYEAKLAKEGKPATQGIMLVVVNEAGELAIADASGAITGYVKPENMSYAVDDETQGVLVTTAVKTSNRKLSGHDAISYVHFARLKGIETTTAEKDALDDKTELGKLWAAHVAELNSAREGMLNGTITELNIIGNATGVFQNTKAFNEVGAVLGDIATLDIRIPTVEDADNPGFVKQSDGVSTPQDLRVGKAYVIKNNKVYPLQARKLNDSEVNNISKMFELINKFPERKDYFLAKIKELVFLKPNELEAVLNGKTIEGNLAYLLKDKYRQVDAKKLNDTEKRAYGVSSVGASGVKDGVEQTYREFVLQGENKALGINMNPHPTASPATNSRPGDKNYPNFLNGYLQYSVKQPEGKPVLITNATNVASITDQSTNTKPLSDAELIAENRRKQAELRKKKGNTGKIVPSPPINRTSPTLFSPPINTFQRVVPGLTHQQTKTIVDSVNGHFFNRLFEHGHTPDELLGTKGTKLIAGIYGLVSDDLYEDYLTEEENFLTKLHTPEIWKAIKQHYQLMLNMNEENEPQSLNADVVAVHRTFLKGLGITLGIVEEKETKEDDKDVDTKDDTDDNALTGEETGRSKADWTNSNEESSINSAPNSIKLLVMSLPQVNADGQNMYNEIGGPKLNDYVNTMKLLYANLNGLSQFHEMYNKLVELSDRFPVFKELVERIGAPGSTKELAQFLLETDFRQAFAKFESKGTITLINKETGAIYQVDANANKLKDRIKENWISNLRILAGKPNTYIKIGDDGISYIDPSFITDVRAGKFKGNYKALLSSIGIDFTDLTQEQVQALPSIQDDVNGIFKSLAAEVGAGRVLNTLWDKKADVAGRLDSLLDHEIPLSKETVELSYISAENKRIYAVSLNNFYSLSVSALNNSKSLEQLYRDFPHFKNPYTTSSYWMSRLFDEKGQRIPGTSIQMNTVSGLKIEGDTESGTGATKLEPADKIAQEINDLLGHGFASLIRAADKSTEYAFGLVSQGEKLAVPLRLVQDKGLDNENVKKIFMGYFKDELARIRSFKKGVGAKIQIYQGQADKFSLFADILSPKTLAALEAYKTTEDELAPDLAAVIAKEAIDYLDRYAKDIKQYMADRQIGIAYEKGYTGFDPAFTGMTQKGLDAAIQTFSVNHLINMIEQSKLLVGDSAFYKDKFKRVAAGTGTKKFAANDAHTNNWLRGFYNNIFNRVDKKEPNGQVNVVVFADNKAFQSDIEEYMTALEEKVGVDKARKILEAYAKWDAEEKKWLPNMEEGDAQGWITLDEYREFMIRTGGAYWDERHEAQYRYEIVMEKLDPAGVKTTDLTEAEQAVYHAGNPGFFFMPIKAQYFGPQVMDGIYAPTFHKYSLAPIYHSLVKGRNMESLLNNMREKQIGYAVFGSGVKLGAPLNAEDKLQAFYGDEGVASFTEGTPIQKINYQFLGVQLDIAPKQKDKVIFGSQFRKLLFSNLFGDNTKDWAKKLSNEYLKVIDDLVQLEMTKLTKKLGLAYNEKGELSFTADKGDFRKLVETLRESLEDKDTADNILDSLQVDDKGQLIYPIDSMVNRTKIESMLFSIVNSKVIKQKMAGDGLVQLASTGFEPLGKRTIGTSNYLKFYRKGKNGKTLAMEVEVPMMKTFEPLLKMYGTLDKLNAAIAAGTIDPKMLTMIGYRIPTQGLNSIDHMTIKRFLPSTAGNALILPTGVVAKSGGDYDIDKLNVFRPQMYFDEKSGKVVLYDTKKLDKEGKPKKEGLQNRVVEIAAEILSHEDNYIDLITPNTTDTLVELVGDIRAARGESRGVVKASATKEFRFDTIMEQFTYFLGGKAGVGIGAVHNTHHILSQMSKVMLNMVLPFKSNIVSTTKKVMKPNIDGDMESQDEVTTQQDLSQQYTQGGQKISDLISQFINAYVDVAKDPFYKDLNAGTDTAGVWFYLMRAGVDVKTIGYFMTQPIILDYVNAKKLNKSLVITGAGLSKYDKMLSKAVREKAQEEFDMYSGEGPFINPITEERISRKEAAERLEKAKIKLNGSIYNDALAKYGVKERVEAGDFNQDDINDQLYGWLKEGKSVNKSQAFRIAQTQMLSIFMNLENQSRGLTELMADTNNDTNKLQNYGSIEQRRDIANRVATNTGLIPAGTTARIKKSTIVGSFDLTEKISRMFKELTLYTKNPLIKAGIRDLIKNIDRKADFAKEYSKIQNDFIGYVTQKFGKADDGTPMYTKIALLSDQTSPVKSTVTSKKGVFNVTPIQTVDKKAAIKASVATQYIGFADGIAGSSTDHYRKQAGEFANTGNYSEADTIFVSVGGNRGSEKTRVAQQDRTIKEAIKAVEAGATLVVDNKFYIASSDYNSGEKRLAANLKNKGYSYAETVVDGQMLGVWTKEKQTSSNPSLAKQLIQMRREGLLKDNPFVNELIGIINADSKAIDNIKMYSRRISAFESNVYTEAFRELINSTDKRISEFGKNLAYATILQSGLQNSPISFTELVPFEFYGKIVKAAIAEANVNIDMDDFKEKRAHNLLSSYGYRLQDYGITAVPQDNEEQKAADKLLPKQNDSTVAITRESKEDEPSAYANRLEATYPAVINGINTTDLQDFIELSEKFTFDVITKVNNKGEFGKAVDTFLALPATLTNRKEIDRPQAEWMKANPEAAIRLVDAFIKSKFDYTNLEEVAQELLDSAEYLRDKAQGELFNQEEELNEKQQLKPLVSLAGERVDVDTGEVFNVDANGKRVEKPNQSTDTFQYFGAPYTILIEDGMAIGVDNYKSKEKAMQKIVDAYNTDKDTDPQNGQKFRNKALTANQQLQLDNNALIEKARATSNAKRNAENAAKKEASKYELFPGVFANDGQKLAIDKIDGFLKDAVSPAFLLKGRGGTGKTTIIKKALDSAKGKLFGATIADEARGVLAKAFPGLKTSTIASLIGSVTEEVEGKTIFRLKNVDELEHYYVSLGGEGAKIDSIDLIGKGGVLIIDEASMIDSETYYHLMMRAEHNNIKVIFMGDNVQIQPIGESNSPVFDLLNTSNHAVLTERMRQGAESPILPITDLLAENVEAIERGEKGVKNPMTGNRVTNFNENTNEGVIFTQSQTDFLDGFAEDFKNTDKTIIAIAFRNDIVDKMNLQIRSRLYDNPASYEIGEMVRLNALWAVKVSKNKTDIKGTNGFRGKVTAVRLNGKQLGFQVYALDVEYKDINEKTGKEELKIKELTGVAVKDKAAFKIALEKLRKETSILARTEGRGVWSNFFSVLNAVADINYNYAITANKVQGSTYDTAYVNERDISSNYDSLDAQKKLYTAVSRPRTKLVLLNIEVAIDEAPTPVRQAPQIGTSRKQAREINNLDNESIEEGLVDKTCKL